VLSAAAAAEVHVVSGPTLIPQGEARSPGDLTVINDKLAFSLAIESPVPYGVARGALIDLAPVTDGRIGRDCVVFADFIPDNWSAWPNTYRHVEVLEHGPQRVLIRVVRDWGRVTISTEYSLEANADLIRIKTTMRNGGTVPLEGLLSGMTLWPRRGYLFAVPGMSGVTQGKIGAAVAHRVVAYDEDFTVALHAPYADTVGDGSMDLYLRHSLRAGETRVFTAVLQVGASGDLQPIIRQDIRQGRLGSGTVRGTVTGIDGKLIERPLVIVEKEGHPYGWVIGKDGEYRATLPTGAFALYASARNYSQSERTPLTVSAGGSVELNFPGLGKPGAISFTIADAASGAALDARMSIATGQVPVVQFLGRKTLFTELDRKGHLDVPIAPGEYVFDVSAGGGFLSQVQRVPVVVAPGQTTALKVAISSLFAPSAQHWYSADMHHHADQAEAVTPPQDLARSQLAAGLDLLFVSDHDSTANHGALQAIAQHRGVVFVPGIELSPSWGHFNAYPWRLGEKLEVDTGTASVNALFAEARRHGATVIQANHPWIPYGYFSSLASGVAPGGFNPTFDLIEINAAAPEDDMKVLHTAWNFWNGGHRYYLSGGTDTHDVWLDESGSVRTFAHVEGTLSADTFAQALRAGHGYVSSGPLVFPSVVFGETLKVKPGASFSLGFDLSAVAGLAEVDLISAGDVQQHETLSGSPTQAHVEFPLSTPHPTWYALIVKDAQGHKAYTDPIWVDAIEFQP
jgi:hypothetical protein